MSDRDATVADVVREAIGRSYDRLVAHEQLLRTSDDPEGVHQARVATRRLRSDLRTFAPFVDAAWATELRGELRWLGAELGAVRDLEVQRDRLRAHAATLPPAEATAAERVVRRLDADRTAARGELLAMLSDARYTELRRDVAAAAARPRCNDAARAPAAHALRPVVHHRWKQVRRAVRALGDNPPDAALHGVRIRAKKARYAAEACEPAFGKPARRFARALADVQDVLGEQHDAVVAVEWLAKTAHECSPAEAYAVGMLAQLQRAAADAARASFPAVWERADTSRVRGWL